MVFVCVGESPRPLAKAFAKQALISLRRKVLYGRFFSPGDRNQLGQQELIVAVVKVGYSASVSQLDLTHVRDRRHTCLFFWFHGWRYTEVPTTAVPLI